MAKKIVRSNIAAVIDIGSNEIKLKIAQNKKGVICIIDSVSYPISIGRDTFTTGKISFEKSVKACGIISGFIKICKDYGVIRIRAVATSAVREAENKDYVLDQIALRTGLTVEVIDNQDEKHYIYKMMLKLLEQEHKESAMMVYIGYGNLGVSIIKDEKIPFNQNIRIGSLRLSEMFEDMQDYSKEFHVVVEEYLDSFTDYLQMYLPQNIKCFIASGSEISLIANLCGEMNIGGFLVIKRDKFNAIYEKIKFMNVNALISEYKLTLETAEIILPSMCIYNRLLKFTKAETIISPDVYLIDSLLFEELEPNEYAELSKIFYKNTAICARTIAERFCCSVEHFQRVEKFSLKIFDKIKKIHGMGSRERVLLQSAAILHDSGKIINGRGHYIHSYNIIKGIDLVGLNDEEIEIIASIALYHSRITPGASDNKYNSLTSENKVCVSKLAAILRIADSLDRSHVQKFENIDVSVTEEDLTVTLLMNSSKNIELEEWSFNDKGKFFEEVFGLKTLIKKKIVNTK